MWKTNESRVSYLAPACCTTQKQKQNVLWDNHFIGLEGNIQMVLLLSCVVPELGWHSHSNESVYQTQAKYCSCQLFCVQRNVCCFRFAPKAWEYRANTGIQNSNHLSNLFLQLQSKGISTQPELHCKRSLRQLYRPLFLIWANQLLFRL